MTWGEFERFAMDGPDREWISMLFWPQFIACMAFLIAAPIRDAFLCSVPDSVPVQSSDQTRK